MYEVDRDGVNVSCAGIDGPIRRREDAGGSSSRLHDHRRHAAEYDFAVDSPIELFTYVGLS